jgi:hypothetical protein
MSPVENSSIVCPLSTEEAVRDSFATAFEGKPAAGSADFLRDLEDERKGDSALEGAG